MALSHAFDSVLAAAQEGAEWAWQRLYGEYAPPLLGYLRARGAADPEDLLGEVFLEVAQRVASFQGGESGFRSWVFTIAHSRLVDDRRRRSRRSEVPLEESVDRPAPEGQPEEAAMADAEAARVAELLAGLTPDQREVVLLRVFGGLSLEEVASVLGKPLTAVKSLQHRAFGALRRKARKAVSR